MGLSSIQHLYYGLLDYYISSRNGNYEQIDQEGHLEAIDEVIIFYLKIWISCTLTTIDVEKTMITVLNTLFRRHNVLDMVNNKSG